MTKLSQIYKCEVCGNIVEVVHAAGGKLVCCKQPMALYEENTKDAAVEKHVPVISQSDAGLVVTVGSALHPMAEEHYIEWIEVLADGKVYRQHLQPGQEPKATFCIDAEQLTARAYCNLHGLWKS